MTTIRTRLLATSMITGMALIAAPAFAADATADTSPMATMNGASAAPAAAPVQTLRATADAAADTTASTAEIVVTGSRIPQPNLTSVSPIQAVGHQEFQLEGHTDVIDLLNNLPQNFQNNAVDFSNTSNPLAGPGGITTADLRGLGPQRTLVLVNGRRLGIGDANTQNPNPAPDLDQIPAAMIDHVEVLTGGASSAYGSDAMAGVVNFILKKDFEGVQLDGTIGGDQHDQHNGYVQTAVRAAIAGHNVGPIAIPGDRFDGGNADASLIIGANAPDGKGNVTAYFEYHNSRPVRQANRDWSACTINDSSAPNTQFCSGSTNANKFTSRNGPLVLSAGGHLTPERFTAVGNGLVPWPSPGSQPPAVFNSNAYEFLSRGDVRYIGGYTAHYDISPQVQVYSEFNMMDDRTTVQIAPSAAFSGGNPFDTFGDWQINCNNPFLAAGPLGAPGTPGAGVTASQFALGCKPADVAAGTLEEVNIGRRNVEGGPRQSYFEHFNFRGVAGVRGDLNDTWHYDAYGSYYYTFLFQDNSNYLSNSRIGNALDVVTGPGGQPFCAGNVPGGVITAPGCVPWNILQQGGVTQAALNYLTIAGTESGTVAEQVVEGDLTGDLGKYGWKSPWASDGIGLALGADWRRDEISFTPDAIIGSGDLGGGSGVGTTINNAGISVWEGYGETRIPIAQDMPFIKLLQLDGGVRYSAYAGTANAQFNTLTWKVGLEWSPTDDVRFRGAYNKAIRAPNIIELFNPQSVSQAPYVDPCLAAAPKLSLAQCERTGLPAGLYGAVSQQCPGNQCDQLVGGNPGLKPEFADTFTVGATFTPHWVRGLTFSVDWWDIMNYGFVNAPGSPGNIINDCAVNDNPASCALIHRAPSTGLLFGPSNVQNGGYVSQTAVNVGNGQLMGIDLQGDYHLDLEDVGVHGWGSLSWALNGSYLLKNASFTAGSSQDCAGLFGPLCQTVNPHWRHTIRMTWNSPWNALFSLQWRYIGGTTLDLNVFQNAGDIADGHLPAMNYLDLASEWRVNTHLTVRAGVNNVLDTDPPVIAGGIVGSGTPNTYPTYDLLGRELFLSGTVRF